MMKLALAIYLQIAIFAAYNYIDARMVTVPIWKRALTFGLNPLSVLFFGLSPIVMWWSFRVVMAETRGRFWTASLILGALNGSIGIVCKYLGTDKVPTIPQAIGIVCMLVGAIISSL